LKIVINFIHKFSQTVSQNVCQSISTNKPIHAGLKCIFLGEVVILLKLQSVVFLPKSCQLIVYFVKLAVKSEILFFADWFCYIIFIPKLWFLFCFWVLLKCLHVYDIIVCLLVGWLVTCIVHPSEMRKTLYLWSTDTGHIGACKKLKNELIKRNHMCRCQTLEMPSIHQ